MPHTPTATATMICGQQHGRVTEEAKKVGSDAEAKNFVLMKSSGRTVDFIK